MNPRPKTITLALTGASGMPYAMRLLECLLRAECRVYVLYSQVSQIVLRQELEVTLPSKAHEAKAVLCEKFQARQEQLEVFGREEWFAPIASGSNPSDAMVVCPCTTGTLASIALGLSDSLLERAADVMIKERRKLILVPRETPFSAIHLEHMLTLARLGVVVLPANPGFYHHPQSVQDLVDFVVARILDHLGVAHTLIRRWGDAEQKE